MTGIYSVPAISCGHCKQTIEAAALDVDGVTSATVDVAAKSVEVHGTVTESHVRAALAAVGYDVENVTEP